MSAIRGAIALAAGTVLVGGLWWLNNVQAFTTPSFSVKKLRKGSKFLVKGHRGEYKDAKKFAKDLPDVSAPDWVAIYWDDPRIMNDRCRFHVGIPSEGMKQETKDALIKDGFIECEVEEDVEALYCAFPYTGTVSGIVAAIKVYPAWVEAAKTMGKGHGPIVKITPNQPGGFTEFYFLVAPPKDGSSFAKTMMSAK